MFLALKRHWSFMAFALLLASTSVAEDMRQLVADISGPDMTKRIRARQLLPREGVEALPMLLPMLSHEDQGIRYTARNVIADILNTAAAPGHEADQLVASRLLLDEIGPDAQHEQIRQVLRLVPIVVPEGFDVGPVAALLANDDWKEKARECLQETGTRNACVAMVAAIPDAEDDFKVALLNAIGKLEEPESVDPLKALASHSNPAVRAAAAMALSWTGDPKLAPVLQDIAAKSTPETQFVAYDALLRLTDNIALNGGNWNLAMSVYRAVLEAAPSGIIQAGAVMGLARYGDATVVDAIVATAKSGDPHMADTCVQALTSLQGHEAKLAVLDAYPSLAESMRVALISVWGQRKEMAALDLMKEELNSGVPALRDASLNALASMESMQAFAPLVEVARNGSVEEKEFALASVKKMAGPLGNAGNAQAAGLAFMQLYDLAEDDALRNTCLQGLARYPVAQAYDLVKAAMEQPALKDAAANAIVSVAGALAAEDKDRAKEAIDVVRSANASPEVLVQLAQRLQGAGVPVDFANLLGFVRSWYVIGPFDWKDEADWDRAFVNEPKVDATTAVSSGDQSLQWKTVNTSDPLGMINLIGEVGQYDRKFAYAYAEIDVPEETDAQLRLGSDDGNKVWLNGEVVWENRVDRGAALDQDIADVHLVKGVNRVLVKISQGGGGWNFNLRVAQANGAGVEFTQVAPKP
ncbi:MAG: HEAT repeat domain-containing protein [Candidatus Hydrogenedentes bacterium]|nr:HEAT repeat domain-containing protein [Candidatus Hydrogenedentota bacterium]